MWNKRISTINEAYVESQKEHFEIKKWRIPSYYRVVDFSKLGEIKKTGLDQETLRDIGKKISQIPSSFTPHNSIKKIYEARAKSIETGEGIDFGLA